MNKRNMQKMEEKYDVQAKRIEEDGYLIEMKEDTNMKMGVNQNC